MRWDRVMDGAAAVPGDQPLTWYFLVAGRDLNPRRRRLLRLRFRISPLLVDEKGESSPARG
jgi:hypothetical protein